MATTQPARPASPPARRIFGQPRWFRVLFLTDMWERFSFYGMQAILFLFAVSPTAQGGLGLSPATATAMFGLYMALVFIAAVPGAWLGDRVLGARRATLVSGMVIAAGHACMAVPAGWTVWAGLALIIAGTGLLKPNMSALLSSFYGPGDGIRREAAFSIFYMSIQVSALVAPIVTGFLGETVDWHLGFGAAALGMAFGVIQFAAGSRHFGEVGARPVNPATPAERHRVFHRSLIVAGVAAAAVLADGLAGTLTVEHVLIPVGLLVLVVPVILFRRLLRHALLTVPERMRVLGFVRLFLSSAVFWMIFTQSGSVLSLFARESVDRDVLGFEIPASWFQSAHPLFIIAVAPLFAYAWVRLGRRVDVPAKFALGLGLVGLSYLLMAVVSVYATTGGKVSPLWLLTVFFLQACGELALAPVGIGAAGSTAPAFYTSQMMGLWWVSAAVGAALGGRVGQLAGAVPAHLYYIGLGGLAILVGAALLARGRRLTSLLTAS
ncbi:POT family proton-dependent oligopeptide transporter [Nonomuraea polychroma]|uniref:POT family proton-dependent oligopeptide transporter n=1 Tax=Nonomuraea polychroma TaxID=46176 RepID=A0A438MF70_9ACTN|nr:peptide MFS transporter [Nonomuraea polychroma]RVX44151.1 POT family proton-dependent oligopeptide transporter [Nonomuraea polychroma]